MSNKALQIYQKILQDYDYFITIDPGARDGGGTGVAVFRCENKNTAFQKIPIETYQLESKLPTWLEKVDEIADELYGVILDKALSKLKTIVFIERPKFFESLEGQTAARSDSLFKLCFITGRLYGVIKSFNLS